MPRTIAHVRAYTVRGQGADYHDQGRGHWIDDHIATPMSVYPEYRESRQSFGINVLGTLVFDLGRFGIQFVASPRHADGLLVTGPVTENMRGALLDTYAALPSPRLVIASGACAIGGGPFRGSPEHCNGIGDLLPVDLYIPGCPPHPYTALDGLLRLVGRLSHPEKKKKSRRQ